MEILPFSPAGAGEEELRECYALFAEEVRENFPEARLIGFAAYAEDLRKPNTGYGIRRLWLARGDDGLLGNAVAALTELSFLPNVDDVCWRRDTAVVKSFRGLGLGRAVKSAMMRWVLADRPLLEIVRTDVDASNLYMLRVNEQLGYTVLSTVINMETSVESLAGALGIAA